MKRIKLKILIKYIIYFFVLFGILNFFGVFTHMFEIDYYSSFNYSLNEDISVYIEQLKNHDTPSLLPINIYNYSYIKLPKEKCNIDPIRLTILIKSKLENNDKRAAIRNTFGYEKRFSDVIIRTVFLLGNFKNNREKQLSKTIDEEFFRYNDIIQADFIDDYYNNTIKTMMGFKWAIEYCSKSKYYLFSDDDMYISIKNVLRFIRNPAHYPEYVEHKLSAVKNIENIDPIKISNNLGRKLSQMQSDLDFSDDVLLYSGCKFESSPHRHRLSKWFVSLEEYPYHLWPPYISAGSYILSREALITMYYASFYTTHFRFDDIYLGLLAKKSGIEPFNAKEFYFYKKPYDKFNYKYVISSHGYDDTNELLKVWNEQRELGNA